MERTFDARLARLAFTAACALVLSLGCATTPDDSSASGTGGEFDAGDSLGTDGGLSGTEVREPTPELESIYFDFDMALIRNNQKPTLQSDGTIITEHADWRRVTIEGHGDERGSEEYNLALGERRADAVRRYLVSLGVRAAQLDTVSFGESKPAVQGHDESAWRWNRRAEFRVTR